jgi:3-oxoacyl-[acyl-carrier protein] reductase
VTAFLGPQALDGKRILITGASRGIGAAVCTALATQGARLVLVARDENRLRQLAAGLKGGPHTVVPIDVSDAGSWKLAHRIVAPEGVLDAVVPAAAALGPIGPIGTWDIEDFRRTLDLNVCGTLLAVLAGIEGLRAAKGSIVTFSGGGATSPLPRFDAYAASKAAVVRLTENIAEDLRDDEVRANSVAPGFVLTPMHEETLAAGPERVGEAYFQKTRRAMTEGGGDPPELAADLVGFLVSDASRGITGKLISARWDPWREVAFQDRLRTERDLASLRRIDDQVFTPAGRAS